MKRNLMLTDHETRFMNWWEKNRLKEKRSLRQWLVGLPAGLIFGIPILLNFASGWYQRATMWARGHTEGGSSMVVVLIAVILIATFVALFYKKHRWDMNEQLFKELTEKKNTAEKQLSLPPESL